MATNGRNSVVVLYKVVNSETDNADSLFNAFSMPVTGPKGVTLASVKQNCVALHCLNHLGPEGFHWRVCIEDKPIPGESAYESPSFSWWDIQDENAKLPIKQAPQGQLRNLFAPPKQESSSSDGSTADVAAKAAKGAFKTLGKAMSAVSGGVGVGVGDMSSDDGPPVNVIAFKLLDLVKMNDDFEAKHKDQRGGRIPQQQQQPRAPRAPAPRPAPQQQYQQPQHVSPPAATMPRPQPQTAPRPMATPGPAVAPTPQQSARQPPRPAPQRAPVPAPQPPQQENLMDFGPAPASAPMQRTMRHATSSPAVFESSETRAERLQREYAEKNQKANRVWDDIDQRWVEVDPEKMANAAMMTSSTSAPPGSSHEPPAKKEVGISLDPANAVGKSAHVQAAVHKRVNDMRESQEKALQEVREREQRKKMEEAEEDIVRKKLEPIVKTWSEEHGKKKQLRALLASLHTILWPEADWKQISIGDILDDGKVKRCFHKASRVVHPDKTHHLDAEKRFLAKRIFDALSQAKNDFDNGAK